MNEFLGKHGKDKITGFEGIITGFCEYLTGCNQLLLAPTVDEKGGHRSGQWYDVQRVEVTGEAITLDNTETPGCDISAPVR